MYLTDMPMATARGGVSASQNFPGRSSNYPRFEQRLLESSPLLLAHLHERRIGDDLRTRRLSEGLTIGGG